MLRGYKAKSQSRGKYGNTENQESGRREENIKTTTKGSQSSPRLPQEPPS